jgi:predicted transcriptional regulator
MANPKSIINFLKKELRSRGFTYKSIGEEIGISESAVKHMFSSGNCSLNRLDQLAKILDLEISDVVQLSTKKERKVDSISLESENDLVKDTKLLVIGYACINYWSFDDILTRYNLSETELIPYLAKLDRMGIISLLPNNQIKPLFANNFSWHEGGPMDRFVKQRVQPKFFESRFSEPDAIHLFKHGDLTEKSRFLLKDRINSLGEYYDELSYNDRDQDPFSVKRGTSMVLATRNWSFQPFLDLKRT